jgi:hypothetical protein
MLYREVIAVYATEKNTYVHGGQGADIPVFNLAFLHGLIYLLVVVMDVCVSIVPMLSLPPQKFVCL